MGCTPYLALGPAFFRCIPGSRLLCAEPRHADPHGEVFLLLGAELEAQDLVDEVAVGEVAFRGLLEGNRLDRVLCALHQHEVVCPPRRVS